MEFHFKIRVDAPGAGVRRLVMFAGVPVTLLMITAAVARATLTPNPTTWVKEGQPVSAANLSQNLIDLDNRLTASAGVYCGTTGAVAMTTLASSGGYFQATKECAIACGSSAHMCSNQEIIRSLSVDNPLPIKPGPGWITGNLNTDCLIGYASAAHPYYDSNPGGAFTQDTCGSEHGIHCCQ
jgi:hypothetical protein